MALYPVLLKIDRSTTESTFTFAVLQGGLMPGGVYISPLGGSGGPGTIRWLGATLTLLVPKGRVAAEFYVAMTTELAGVITLTPPLSVDVTITYYTKTGPLTKQVAAGQSSAVFQFTPATLAPFDDDDAARAYAKSVFTGGR